MAVMTKEEIAAYSVDRSGWSEGPWDSEPDRVDFEHAGLHCMVIRNDMGALCGYVGVPRGHALYMERCDDVSLDVHGGVTYAEKCAGHICHAPGPGQPDDVWWLGFDCTHAGDTIPGLVGLRGERWWAMFLPDEAYRDMAYVSEQCRSLADQASAYKG